MQTHLRASANDEVPLPPGFRRVEWPGGQSSQAGSKQIIFAVDNLLQRNVVIAALRAPDDSEQRLLALAEAQRLAQVCDHPNIITIHSAMLSGDWLLLVNQYAAGGDLRRLLTSGPMTLARAVRLAQQMIDALRHAHKHQIIHRDLKPENVLLNDMFEVQLADFGIAIRADAVMPEDQTVGTPGYMAPEQIRGVSGAAADLYSFGCVLFELLTQRPVFQSDNSFELLRRHLSDVPTAPSAINPRVPSALSDLCVQLLAKTPAARPASAVEVLERLTDFQRAARAFTARRTPGAQTAITTAQRLLGRASELAQIAQRSGALQSLGTGGVVLIDGTLGAGKSRFVEELEPYAQSAGATLLLGRCLEGVKLPFLPFIEALRPLRGALNSDGPGDRLQRLLSSTGTTTQRGSTARASRETLLIELDGALRVVAAQRPLVLVIDDLHWADESSLALFQQLGVALAASPTSLPLLLIGTLRPVLDAGPAQRGLSNLLQRLRRYANVLELSLPALDVSAVRQLVEDLTGSPCSERLAAQVSDMTLGNPLHARELVSHLSRHNLLQMRGGFLLAAGNADDLALPQGLAALVAERLDSLTDTARRVLSVAACIAGQWSLEQLALLLHETPRATHVALDEAEQAGIIRGQRGDYTFVHPLMRAALYGRLSDSSRRVWHYDIARQLADGAQSNGDESVDLAIAQHLLLAGDIAPLSRRLQALDAAASLAFDQFAWEQAAGFAEAVLVIGASQPADWIARLQQLAGDALHQAGEARAALPHWRNAAHYYREQGDAVRLAAVLGSMFRAGSSFGFLQQLRDGLPEELERVANQAALTAPEVAAQAFDALGIMALGDGHPDVAERFIERGARLLGESRTEKISRARMYGSSFVVALQRGRPRDAVIALRAGLADAEGAEHAPTIVRQLQRLPVPLVLLGDLSAAAEIGTQALQRSSVIATTGEHSITQSAMAALHVLRGDFQLAVEAGEAALELLCTTSYTQAAAYLLPVLLAAYAHQGRFVDARRVARLLSDGDGVLDPPLRLTQLHQEHEALLIALEQGGSGRSVVTRPVPERAIDFLRLGRYGVAMETVSLGAACDGVAHCLAAFDMALRNDIAFTLGWTGYVPRWLALARWRVRGDAAEAVLLLDACRTQTELIGAKFETARCTFDLAVAHQACGHALLARAARDAAHAQFDALGAYAWVRVMERSAAAL